MTQFRLAIDGQERAFEVSQQGEQLHVSASPAEGDGDAGLTAEVRVLHRNGPRLLLEIAWPDGTTERVHVAGARQGDRRQLWVEGRGLTAERVRRRGGGSAATQGSLAAAIPAVVSQILIAPGDAVAAGDKLILLESMKMVIPIVAPRDGVVARVLCALGESVPAGVPLIELADAPAAGNNPG